MSDKNKGLYKKYEVTKVYNPTKKVDALVLEFDDQLSQLAIFKYAKDVGAAGYEELSADIISKLNEYTGNKGIFF